MRRLESDPARAPDRDGFALLGALWMVVAIAAASAVLWHRFHGHALLAQNHQEAVQTRAAASAGVARVQQELHRRLVAAGGLDGAPAESLDPWNTLPDSWSATVGDAHYDVKARELDTLLSLNLTAEGELVEFLETAGVPTPTARTIAASTLDWRDSDGMRRARGAEAEWYLASGSWSIPRNGPFAEVSELRGVRAVTDSLYRMLEPLITIRGDGRVNLNTAPAPVIAALPGFGVAAARRLVAARNRGVRYASVYDAVLTLAPGDRDPVEAVLPTLVARTTFTTDRLLLESTGSVSGGRIHHMASAVMLRQGTQAILAEVHRGW